MIIAYAILVTVLAVYLSIRVYKLRKALKDIHAHLAEIESKIPVLRP